MIPDCVLCGFPALSTYQSCECKMTCTRDNGGSEVIMVCGACVRFAWRDHVKLEGVADDADRQRELDQNFWYWVKSALWTELERKLLRKWGYVTQIRSLTYVRC